MTCNSKESVRKRVKRENVTLRVPSFLCIWRLLNNICAYEFVAIDKRTCEILVVKVDPIMKNCCVQCFDFLIARPRLMLRCVYRRFFVFVDWRTIVEHMHLASSISAHAKHWPSKSIRSWKISVFSELTSWWHVRDLRYATRTVVSLYLTIDGQYLCPYARFMNDGFLY